MTDLSVREYGVIEDLTSITGGAAITRRTASLRDVQVM